MTEVKAANPTGEEIIFACNRQAIDPTQRQEDIANSTQLPGMVKTTQELLLGDLAG